MNFFTVLQNIEKLIFKILMWIILIPKTIVRIILQPRQMAMYVKSELTAGKEHFDEYVSPVILLLVVALLPALGYNALPKFGATLSSPAKTNPTVERSLIFDATADFISAAPDREYYVAWEVWKKDAGGEYIFEGSDYHVASDEGTSIVQVDSNTITDRFQYTFTSGEYLVYASVGNADTRREDIPTLETYDAYLNVLVPESDGTQVQVSSDTAKTLDEKASSSSSGKNFLDSVKDERTIFLALALMIPPLLFAFAAQIFKTKWVNIGEETLKENFYVQCYYFSPLALAIWATYYAYYFFTADVYWYVPFNAALIILFPLAWAALWFIRTEVKRIAWELEVGTNKTSEAEKKTTPEKEQVEEVKEADSSFEDKKQPPGTEAEISVSKKNTLISSAVVVVCTIILVYGVNLLISFQTYMDNVRRFAIRAFPIGTLLLMLGFAIAWVRRRRERKENLLSWNIAGLTVFILMYLIVINWINGSTTLSAPSVGVAEAQAQAFSEWIPPATLEVVQIQPTEFIVPTTTPVFELAQATSTLPPTETLAAAIEETETSPTFVPSETPTVTSTSTPMPVPTFTSELTLSPIPTVAPSPFYVEEFDTANGLLGWVNFMTFGDLHMVTQLLNPGKLSVSILPLDDKYAWYYLINNNFTYSNVKVETVVTNQGNNANGVSLICRYSDLGWYEFVLSNNGTYSIFAVDTQDSVNQRYNELANGGSVRIKTGRQTNTYMAICSGNELVLIVNGTEVRKVTDDQFQFAEGRIGLAVSAMQKLPVSVDFESLTVSEP